MKTSRVEQPSGVPPCRLGGTHLACSTLARFITLSLLFTSLNSQADTLPIPEFKAVYSLQLNGITVGESSRSLQQIKPQQYRYSANSHSSGLAAWLKPDIIEERSTGRYQASGFQPSHYLYQQTGGKKQRKQEIEFDWINHQAKSRDLERSQTIRIPDGALDNYVYQLQLMLDLSHKKDKLQYHIVKEDEVNAYQLNIVGNEVLSTPLGKLKTVIVERQHPSRTTRLWCAESLHYLPVRVAHTEKGKTLVAEIESLSGLKTQP